MCKGDHIRDTPTCKGDHIIDTMLAIREHDDAASSDAHDDKPSPQSQRPATPDQDDKIIRSLLVERMQSHATAQPRGLRQPKQTSPCLSFKHIRLYGGLVHISTGEHKSLPSTTLQDDLAILQHVRQTRLDHSST